MRVSAAASFNSYQQVSRGASSGGSKQTGKATESSAKANVKTASQKQTAFRADDVKAGGDSKGKNFSAGA